MHHQRIQQEATIEVAHQHALKALARQVLLCCWISLARSLEGHHRSDVMRCQGLWQQPHDGCLWLHPGRLSGRFIHHLRRYQPNSSRPAHGPEEEAADSTEVLISPVKTRPLAGRRSAWAALLEFTALAAVVAGFGALQWFKSFHPVCSKAYGVFYAGQVALCLSFSLLSLTLLGSFRKPAADEEAPLLSHARLSRSTSISKPISGKLPDTTQGLWSGGGVSSCSCCSGQCAMRFALTCLAGALVAGLCGLGGGQVTTPLFLEMGAPPQVAAATTLLVVFCNSSSASLQFALGGLLDYGYAEVYVALCFASSLVGGLAMSSLVRRTGHASYLILLLAFMLAAGGMAVVFLTGVGIAGHFRRGQGLPGFDSICQ